MTPVRTSSEGSLYDPVMRWSRPDVPSNPWHVTAVFDPPDTKAAAPDTFWLANHLARFFNASDVDIQADDRMANIHVAFTTAEEPRQAVGRIADHLESQYGWTQTGIAYYSDGPERRSRPTAGWLRALLAVLPGK